MKNKTKTILEVPNIKLSPRDLIKATELVQSYVFPRKTPEALLEYLEKTNDFPDKTLADNIENASKEFRRNFKLNNY